jgi:hypothetical protein
MPAMVSAPDWLAARTQLAPLRVMVRVAPVVAPLVPLVAPVAAQLV